MNGAAMNGAAMNGAAMNGAAANPPKAGRLPEVRILLELLETLAGRHAELVGLLAARREAVRRADFTRFGAIDDSERRILAEVADLDRRRVEAARGLAVRLALPQEATLAEIAARLSSEDAARIDAARGALRELVERVRRESGVLRQAVERLSAHMAGVLQSVHSALAQASVYSRAGRLATGATVLSSVDVRS